MVACGIKKDELGSEEKKILTKIENKEHNDKNQLKADKNKLLEFFGKKEVDKKIKSYEKEIDIALKSKDKTKKEIVGGKILKLLEEDNIYVERRKDDIQKLLAKLTETSSSTTKNPKSDFP